MKRIVCYGDSNTWGYVPGTGERYDENTRWPALLQKQLGEAYHVIEAGMNARTTSFDDPACDFLNGRKGLMYVLLSAKPVDLLIISLGTNDLKYTDAQGSAKGLNALLHLARAANHICSDSGCTTVFRDDPKILVISPIPLHPKISSRVPRSSLADQYETSLHFEEYYTPVCRQHGVHFLNAALYAEASGTDCVHMSPESHAKLSLAVADTVRHILP